MPNSGSDLNGILTMAGSGARRAIREIALVEPYVNGFLTALLRIKFTNFGNKEGSEAKELPCRYLPISW